MSEPKNDPSTPDFLGWGERFFAYLVNEKSGTNPALLELVYCLGDDGRQEIALSVFNFLRTDRWKQFCRQRQIAKYNARKQLTTAKSDLQRAAKLYGKMLASFPELGFCRKIGDDRPIHLSDLLEGEATFLRTQARIMRCASRQVSSIDSSKTKQLCSKVSGKLTRAARSYRKLLTLTATIRIGAAFPSFSPNEFKVRLESQAADLAEISSRVNSALNKKRFGINVNWAFLVRLQDFIEEFGLRAAAFLPAIAARKLSESDLTDLIEAGEVAWNRDKDPIHNAESISRALERFRLRKNNVNMCLSLRRSAQEICDGLALWNHVRNSHSTPNIQLLIA